MNVGMCAEKGLDLLGRVGRQVVGDDMDLLAAQLMGRDVGQEGRELGRGAVRGGFAQRLTGLGVESRIQRQCAVPGGLESVTFSVSSRQREHGSLRSSAWIAVFSSTLNTTTFCGAFRYSPITSAALASKSGSLKARYPFEAMRLDAVLGPDARHRHVRDLSTRFCRQFA